MRITPPTPGTSTAKVREDNGQMGNLCLDKTMLLFCTSHRQAMLWEVWAPLHQHWLKITPEQIKMGRSLKQNVVISRNNLSEKAWSSLSFALQRAHKQVILHP